MAIKQLLHKSTLKTLTNLRVNYVHYSTSVPKKVIPVMSWNTLSQFRDKIGVANYLGSVNDTQSNKQSLTYGNLFGAAVALSRNIRNLLNIAEIDTELQQDHIAFLCPNDSSYVVTLLGCWLSGSTAVPLCKSHPVSQLEYFVQDCSASLLIGTTAFEDHIKQLSNKLNVPHLLLNPSDCTLDYEKHLQNQPKEVSSDNRALILYTSGTTGPPKGVVLTHGNLRAQVNAITKAWNMTKSDALLHCLPLHHLHGILNALLTPLSNGGSIIMLPKFDSNEVWQELTSSLDPGPTRVNTFFGVPTMYVKLLDEFDAKYKGKSVTEEFIKAMCIEKIRLMVSGSSALPEPIFDRWEKVTGHRLLERFGMTEIGMGLTNPLKGTRKPGFVGNPLPNVKTRIVKSVVKDKYELIASGDDSKTIVAPEMENESGELQIKGPNVFQQYWNKPDATKSAFTPDGWFKTGDVAHYANDSYKILGRASVDILKSGGFKISALDVENQLLTHEEIAECAVVGLTDITWGQKVAAVIALKNKNSRLNSDKIREWAKTRLPHYSVPSVVLIVDQLPRSPIGKVNKKDLVKKLFPRDC